MGAFAGIEMRGISKTFGSNRANSDVDIAIRPGEIVGLLGENGAGKTTLMNILYGLYQADAGQILLGGEEVQIHSPRDALRLGIGMVHQHFMLVQNHTVAENVALGWEEAPFFFPIRKTREKIEEFGKSFGLQIEPDAPVWQLSAGEQQRVEIVKALIYGAEILILDEPTSVLTPLEAKELFITLREMAKQGKAVVIISHKLEEITDICTRLVILRKGMNVGEADPAALSRTELAKMMVGREVVLSMERPPLSRGDKVLEVERLAVSGDRGTEAVHSVSFSLYRNEIFGIAGVSGNGQRELVEAITGLRKPKLGRIELQGREIQGESARSLSKLGIAHVPEERIKFGIVPNLLIYENSVLKSHHNKPFSNHLMLDYEVIRSHASGLVEDYSVAAPSIDSPMKNLSGGNIQKLIIGREISNGPALLVASHPTYGLDVGATEYIRRRLLDRRNEGGAILLVSEDLEELYALCDRLAVMYRGRIMGIVDPSKTPVEDVGLMMAGALQLPQEERA